MILKDLKNNNNNKADNKFILYYTLLNIGRLQAAHNNHWGLKISYVSFFISSEEMLMMASICFTLSSNQNPEGGTLGISGWECAAGTLEPLTYTRASSAEFCYPTLE